VDFAMDIVEVEGHPAAKRGKLGGRKQVWRCPSCMVDLVRLFENEPPRCPRCDGEMEGMLEPLVENGEIVGDLKTPREIREFAMSQIERMSDS